MTRSTGTMISRDEIGPYLMRARQERAKAIRAAFRRLLGRHGSVNG